MEKLNALQILKKTRDQLEDDHKFAQMYDDAIAELELPKLCETCTRYDPFNYDGVILTIGDCSYGIKYGQERINDVLEWFVPEDFGCIEYLSKDTK